MAGLYIIPADAIYAGAEQRMAMLLRTRAEDAYRLLRSRIESGDYAPGQRLKIRDLARETGASDIPVREAIQRLAAERYLIYTPRVGATVARIPLEEVQQLELTLAVLHGAITRLSAPHLSPAILERLESIIAGQRSAVAQDDTERFGELNRQFHTTIARECPVPALSGTASTLEDRIGRRKSFSLFGFVPSRMEQSIDEHEQLLEMLGERLLSLDGIEAQARRHKLRFLEEIGADALADDIKRADFLFDCQ